MDRSGIGATDLGIPQCSSENGGSLGADLAELTPIPVSFYERDTLKVTEELLGKFLIRRDRRKILIGRIVETEAYIGETDPACHAFRGLTPRTRVMYGPPGNAYVYFTYGMYFMLNAVTETEGFPAAVLIRALEPVRGFNSDDARITSGPGKLCKAMNIDKTLNAVPLTAPGKLWIGAGQQPGKVNVRWTSRIGISEGQDKLWRAYVQDSPFVSRKTREPGARTPSPR